MGAGPVHHLLDIEGMQLFTADDDQFLASTHYVEIAVGNRAYVAAADIRAASITGILAKCLCGDLRLVPITLCHGGAANPDLPQLPVCTGLTGIRIHDGHIGPGGADADQRFDLT